MKKNKNAVEIFIACFFQKKKWYIAHSNFQMFAVSDFFLNIIK